MLNKNHDKVRVREARRKEIPKKTGDAGIGKRISGLENERNRRESGDTRSWTYSM